MKKNRFVPTTFLTDVLGETYQYVAYLPWGEIFVEERNTQTDRNPYLYNGKELDEMTGLYYYGARYYDASVGLFLGVDPMTEKYLSLSPYSYAVNNPIRFIDWMGMAAGEPEKEENKPPVEINILPSPMELIEDLAEVVVAVKEAVSDAVDKVVGMADEATSPDKTSTVGNASGIVGTIGTIVKDPALKKGAGNIGTAMTVISTVKDAATTDFTNPQETADFVESTGQTAVATASGPLAPAVNLIISDSKSDNGVTNTKNLSRSYQSSYRSSASYVYKGNFRSKKKLE